MKTRQEIIQDRDTAILTCRKIISKRYFVIDTETTGLYADSQMVQLGILESNGDCFESFVKATVPICEEASKHNHITDEDVKDAPTATEMREKIPFWNTMVGYNLQFDVQILENSMRARGRTFHIDTLNTPYDIQSTYAKFKGKWSDYYHDYLWAELKEACEECGIMVDDVTPHRALSDCILTDRLLKYMAEQKLSTEE
jgi:DNA polymerase III subunit epsilon